MSVLRRTIAVLMLLALGGCVFATPFRGPGYDAKTGVTAEGTDTVVVALTKAVLRGDRRKRSEFWAHVFAVEKSLSEQPGLIGYSLRTQMFGPVAWTMTVWTDEASLTAFVQGETHQAAIAEGFEALETAGFARFEADRTEIPVAWDRALEALEQSGRSYD